MASLGAVGVGDDALFHLSAVALEGNDFNARKAGMGKNTVHVHHRPTSRTGWKDRGYFSDLKFTVRPKKHNSTHFV
jgi:hypothetical protein